MYPVASQFLFDGRLCGKLSENEKGSKRTQFEIENILRRPSSEVFALDQIAKNTISHQFAFSQVLSETNLPKKFNVNVQSDGHLAPQDAAIKTKFWIRNVRIADDTPGANAILGFCDDQIELKVIKSINANEEILLWFTEEVISFMGIPFLTPSNIQGQKSYVCHHCLRVYENPNPLKIHLARNCDQFDENYIWKRIQTELLSRHQRKVMMQTRNFEILNPFHPVMMQNLPTSSRRFSAFQPVTSNCGTSPSPPAQIKPSQSMSPASHSSLNDSALAAAAHLETIVSNMGTSKQGHLCIYCGKLYSRKYGLKIHIRTHTGFKPLKCKYCYRPFGDPSNLNKHLRLHVQSNEHQSINSSTIFKCHLCNKSLLKRRDLQRHMQLRHSTHEHVITNSESSLAEDSQMTLLSPSSSSSNEDDNAE